MALTNSEWARLPETLKRSPIRAQTIYMHTLESAEETHGDGEAAHRIAFASLKQAFEKIGDHWEEKAERGPSDEQDAKRGTAALQSTTETAEGVDALSSRAHLVSVATRLGIVGLSRMTKPKLVQAIIAANRRETARSSDQPNSR
jgi:cation transport regulator ChaB